MDDTAQSRESRMQSCFVFSLLWFCFVCLFLKLQCVPAPGSCATGVCDGHVRQGGARAALGLLAMNRLQ